MVSCARHMYEHHYDVMFALEYIFQDKTHFLDTFGKKKRWPFAILIESFINYGEPVNENDCSCRSLYSPCCFNSCAGVWVCFAALKHAVGTEQSKQNSQTRYQCRPYANVRTNA